jgi:hypothetical protein
MKPRTSIDPRVSKTYGLDVLRDLHSVDDSGCRPWKAEFGNIHERANAFSLADRLCREEGAAVHVWYDGYRVYRAYPEGFSLATDPAEDHVSAPLGTRPAVDSNSALESTPASVPERPR